ncbi:MAG: hypothetical protein A3C80_03655 [Candidatus Ryanbacteria bacterium RIFCSPHIGHO2_02_FULL_45_43]|uniref:Damage-inducible protein J n=1 Tax=Candidatus Ryanbacteria bacterium RIFCSPHIGHO2_01_45_13 TaxID=1802112 RepID=A0A1G2FVH0_9BACT|nr:MAG: hypothetical protein A2W41_01690 [Candidatus Ryanbacteria bacterium RIFCSPHIGHO2_01_45_13]OGZ42562.1 MAG: hypothetical protein A2718_02910 [Candidatus Ryanbacteria bacterium RIFCSPHIGHO2_01_FULL_44_130]OGZ47772.1 MAG: hypothetical protein A3C80_03655 [Candidatus Ryanbacteria bacterium RIFCSPHIGHO2_02_FULL_45_43]OGZ49665.1 MAG: hypothetical protein A3E55_02110 [Candidatus Ryanbacteria bacterium RIFCSPHIGHO2_12_FULL_44_20]OGZ52158.1 MAG: hypothetical protein A3A17_02975 [Candidatus Ryanba
MLNIKTDRKLKEEAQKTAKALGLPLSLVINQYLKEFIHERRVEFSEPLAPNVKTQKLLEKIKKDIQKRKNLSPVFSSADEAIKHLNS